MRSATQLKAIEASATMTYDAYVEAGLMATFDYDFARTLVDGPVCLSGRGGYEGWTLDQLRSELARLKNE